MSHITSKGKPFKRPSRLVQNIITSSQPAMILSRNLILGIAAIGGFILLGKFLYHTHLLVTGHLDNWLRDIYQYYLMPQAVLDGLSPYSSLDYLTTRFLGGNYVQHPAPYPPPFILFVLPLGFLSLAQMVIAWSALQLLCGVWIAIMLQLWLGHKVRWTTTVLFFLLLMSWYPINYDLILGNSMIILLACVTAAWLALRGGKHIQGGLLLGFIISVKLVGWLFLYLTYS